MGGMRIRCGPDVAHTHCDNRVKRLFTSSFIRLPMASTEATSSDIQQMVCLSTFYRKALSYMHKIAAHCGNRSRPVGHHGEVSPLSV